MIPEIFGCNKENVARLNYKREKMRKATKRNSFRLGRSQSYGRNDWADRPVQLHPYTFRLNYVGLINAKRIKTVPGLSWFCFLNTACLVL